MPADIMNALERTRERVNVAKHEAGLELDHFISASDHAEAMKAIEGFWEHLADCEHVSV
jgi:hypothetical protein